MDKDFSDDGMSDKVDNLFKGKVSPALEAKISGNLKRDPLQDIISELQQMVNGMDTMLEASLLMNSHSIETQMPELKEQFSTNIVHLRDMIREGNSLAAQQKLEDVVKTFATYKRVVASLFSRITNIISEFPKYSSELNDIMFELGDIRSELLDDKVLVITEDDYKMLAVELYNVLIANSKKMKAVDNVSGVEQSTEEIMEEKQTVVDKLGGEKQ